MSTYTLGKRPPRTAARRANRRKNSPGTLGQPRASNIPAVRFVKRVVAIGLCLAVMLVLCVGLVAGYRWLTASSYFAVKTIDISGNGMLAYGDVLEAAGLSLGTNSLEVNVGAVEARLAGTPWVAAVAVRRELPDRLTIKIREVAPRFWVQREDGFYYTDARGRLIQRVHPGNFVSLPVVDLGPYDEENTRVLSALAEMLDDENLPFTVDQIAWIRVGAGEMELHLDGANLSVRLPVDGWRIGLARIQRVWADLRQRGEMGRVASIMTRDGRVWVRKST